MTSRRRLLEKLTSIWLPTAGFRFEEGGCFGFAAALHDLLAQRGVRSKVLVTPGGFVHASVRAAGRCYDHQGATTCSPLAIPVPRSRLAQAAASHGVSAAEFEADRVWAAEELREAIRR